jgi:hypothetical protein
MYDSGMTPMNKQRLNEKKLLAAWNALGRPDFQPASQEFKIFHCIAGGAPERPCHGDFDTYEEYAAALRSWERAMRELENKSKG